MHALRRQQAELNDDTEQLYEAAAAAMERATTLSDVGEEELEAQVRCCAAAAAPATERAAEVVAEVVDDGLRVMAVSEAAVRALAAMEVGPDVPGGG